MTSTITPATHRATFAIGSEPTAKRVVDLLTESFFEGQAAIAAFERPDGRWDITVHFAEPPDQASIRELVGTRRRRRGRAGRSPSTPSRPRTGSRPRLEDLVPVRAGRFIVHGQHDRARVPPNKLGIEIEAALAFGTGHHGTTRGCLLLLDHVLKALSSAPRARSRHRHRRAGDRRGQGAASRRAGQRHRSGFGAGRARQCAAQRRPAIWCETIQATGFAAPQFAQRGPFDLVLANILANPLRQIGDADGAASGAVGAGDPVGPADRIRRTASIAAYRARGLVPLRHLRIDGWSSLLLRNAG